MRSTPSLLVFLIIGLQACTWRVPLGAIPTQNRAPAQVVRAVSATLSPPVPSPVQSTGLETATIPIAPAIRRLMAATSGRSIPWRFQVLDDEITTTWSLPDGRVGLHRAVLELAQSEDEVAFLIAHEMAHVLSRHDAERLATHAEKLGGLDHIATLPTDPAHRALLAATFGLEQPGQPVLPYSRRHEYQADRLAIHLLARAEYDPKAGIIWLARQAEADTARPGARLAVHPPTKERLSTLAKRRLVR
jgi:predicted Zn-dependent protease